MAVAARVESLFAEVRDAHPSVFGQYETVGVTPDEIIEVVTELTELSAPFVLKNQRAVGCDGRCIRAIHRRRNEKEGGEFFTNQPVTTCSAKMVVDLSEGTMLDPLHGGFAVLCYGECGIHPEQRH